LTQILTQILDALPAFFDFLPGPPARTEPTPAPSCNQRIHTLFPLPKTPIASGTSKAEALRFVTSAANNPPSLPEPYLAFTKGGYASTVGLSSY